MSREPLRPSFPEEPSEEELARCWTLSAADLGQVQLCRGERNLRWFALQLCALRTTGRFVEELSAVPVRILAHLNRQLQLEPVLQWGPPERPATQSQYRQRLLSYLGWRAPSSEDLTQLEELWAVPGQDGASDEELLARAEEALRLRRLVLPAPDVLREQVRDWRERFHQELLAHLAGALPLDLCRALDELLATELGARSALAELQAPPPAARPEVLLVFLERYRRVASLELDRVSWSVLTVPQLGQLAQWARRYDAWELRRFHPSKRHALVASLLWETRKTLLDHLVALHDQYVTGLFRRSRNSFEERHREFRKRFHSGLKTMQTVLEILVNGEHPTEEILSHLFGTVSPEAMREALSGCREFQRLEEQGPLDELCARASHLRRYFPRFLELPFAWEPGSEALGQAIVLARRLNSGRLRELPEDAPIHFVPARWRAALRAKGKLDRRLWELALAQAIRDSLRSGDLHLPESRRYVSFSNLIYAEPRWHEERSAAFEELALPQKPELWLEHLRSSFNQAVQQAEQALASRNPFAEIEQGRLKLRRPDALPVPPRVAQLRRALFTHLPRVRIEDLLLEVDLWTGFTRAFQPLAGYQPRSGPVRPTLLATLVAHGTNLGLAAMGLSAEGISVDALSHMSDWLVRGECLKAASTTLIGYHSRLDLSRVWGDGTLSSSDGQRFGLQKSSVLASFYPRYFGYYDQAISVYTHVADQYSTFGTRVISCSPREALYVLDGLLENDSVLRPREHTADTHGFTEQLFGLCYLLGYTFSPRIRDLACQQLYKLDRENSAFLSMQATDTLLLCEQWDQLVRVAASLRHRTAPAHLVVQRLVSSSPSDRLARALTALGRVLKTIHILRYISDESLRRRIQLQLNRGEHRHQLAKWLFFANRGEFRTRDYEEMMNKASCLSLLSNAVLVWNTVHLEKLVTQLRSSGEVILDEDLARISPLAHTHIIPNGTYNFSRAGGRADLVHSAHP